MDFFLPGSIFCWVETNQQQLPDLDQQQLPDLDDIMGGPREIHKAL